MGISCKQAIDYISKEEEHKLSIVQRIQLWHHLLICYVCKRFKQQNTIIINAAGKTEGLPTIQLAKEDKVALIKVLEETTA